MSPQNICDGETFLGFTIKACKEEAKHFTRNGAHEYYQFCDQHWYFYLYGHYVDGSPGVPLNGEKADRSFRHDNDDDPERV